MINVVELALEGEHIYESLSVGRTLENLSADPATVLSVLQHCSRSEAFAKEARATPGRSGELA